MNRKFLVIALAVLVILPLAFLGCKGKVEKTTPDTSATMPEALAPNTETVATPEPAQIVATETIPPSASPALAENQMVRQVSQAQEAGSKDIQTALKNAGFYTGSIDGKIGPKTKKAVEEFQKAKGLKADGTVGPKTWIELEKYLVKQ